VGELSNRQDCTKSRGVLWRECGAGHDRRFAREDCRAWLDRCPAQWRVWVQFLADTRGSVDIWEDVEAGEQAVDTDRGYKLPANTHFRNNRGLSSGTTVTALSLGSRSCTHVTVRHFLSSVPQVPTASQKTAPNPSVPTSKVLSSTPPRTESIK
jgi:hypothetical protein